MCRGGVTTGKAKRTGPNLQAYYARQAARLHGSSCVCSGGRFQPPQLQSCAMLWRVAASWPSKLQRGRAVTDGQTNVVAWAHPGGRFMLGGHLHHEAGRRVTSSQAVRQGCPLHVRGAASAYRAYHRHRS
eukprot:CAMPEP_0176297354 /NCGR_PEP_ID=MMETSP0121_2-20121125/58678_1 /TAXON_ID=160619 /ORGANISM="Kryptoperidinium foliaceum, Strain CCMP 1326" /LENGTH=129 /DNA_ID=CAMNT_0017638539 /DNA_START=77 /DNA_END=463 /DNA_ORIENTATION=+